jgi:HK97 gp10 family phage protein
MSGLVFALEGIPEIKKYMENLENKLRTDIPLELAASAAKIAKDAKRNAPKNLGTLAQSINFAGIVDSKGAAWEVFSTANYAPYVEFGTGGKVSIPAGFETLAAQYKGRKEGTMKEFIKALTLWVQRKGIVGTYSVKTKRRTGKKAVRQRQNEAAAWAIAISILRNGTRPQPFMIPAYEQEKVQLAKRLVNLFKNA